MKVAIPALTWLRRYDSTWLPGDVVAGIILAGLAGELTADGIRLQAVEARSSVRDRLRSEGVEEKLGGINRFISVADAVENCRRESAAGTFTQVGA